ncbi:MAG: hypothetical protein RL189_617 [Pseudomonadota bacterium]|jgi:hypothetical protein
MREYGDFCEEWNVGLAKAGYIRCPPRFCPHDPKAGSWSVPTIKVTLTAGNSQSGTYGRYPGSMNGVVIGSDFPGPMPTNPSQPKTNVSVNLELTIPLSKSADTITCTNPLSQAVIDESFKKIIDHVGKDCGDEK